MTPARLVIAAAALALAGPVLAQVAAPEAAASAPATVAVPVTVSLMLRIVESITE